jgi:hypothetical protein
MCKDGRKAKWHVIRQDTSTFTMKCLACGETKTMKRDYWNHSPVTAEVVSDKSIKEK